MTSSGRTTDLRQIALGANMNPGCDAGDHRSEVGRSGFSWRCPKLQHGQDDFTDPFVASSLGGADSVLVELVGKGAAGQPHAAGGFGLGSACGIQGAQYQFLLRFFQYSSQIK